MLLSFGLLQCRHRYYLTDTVIVIIIIICNMLTVIVTSSYSFVFGTVLYKYDRDDDGDDYSKCKVVNCAECS